MMTILLLIILFMPQAQAFKGFHQPGEVPQFTSTNQSLQFAESSGLSRTNRFAQKVFGTSRDRFSNFTCSENVKNGDFIDINIVYEDHLIETDNRKKMAEDAARGNSLLLLESETNSPKGMSRHLAQMGIRKTPHIRGMDTDLEARSLWVTTDLIDGLGSSSADNIKLAQNRLTEEILRNDFMWETFVRMQRDPNIPRKQQRALTAYIQNARPLKASKRRDRITASRWGTPRVKNQDLVAALQVIKGNLVKSYRESAHKRNSQILQKQRDHCSSLDLERTGLNLPSSARLPTECDPLALFQGSRNDDLAIMDAGFNRRDEVFLDEIGKAICDARAMGMGSINVQVGAGHKENLLHILHNALSKEGLTQRVRLNSVEIEKWPPARHEAAPDKALQAPGSQQ